MADPLDLIFRGCSDPYDDASDPPKVYTGEDLCRVAALAILAGFMNRRGLGQTLDGIDFEVRREIVAEMTEVVRTAMEPALGKL